jgi:hypothetical protein
MSGRVKSTFRQSGGFVQRHTGSAFSAATWEDPMTLNRKWLLGGLVAVGALGGLAYLNSARAADLGGNCCADLEERIAELEATTARKGGRKVTLTISGQVNRAILFVDGDSGMIDNLNSPSRFTMMGEAKLSKDWSAGYLIEIGVGSAEDANVASGGLTGWAGPALGISGLGELTVRHNALWVGTPLGKVWLGHTSTATDGIVEITTANTNVAALPVGSWTGFDGSRTQVLKYEISSTRARASRALPSQPRGTIASCLRPTASTLPSGTLMRWAASGSRLALVTPTMTPAQPGRRDRPV